VHYATELVQACFPVANTDVAYGEYHISIGRTIASNIAAANGDTRCLADAIQRGMKFVTVDPRCSPEASKGTGCRFVRVATWPSYLIVYEPPTR